MPYSGLLCDFGGGNFLELWIYNNYFSTDSYCDNGTGYILKTMNYVKENILSK